VNLAARLAAANAQALPAFTAVAAVVSASAAILFGVAEAAVRIGERQSAADLAALAGAKALSIGSSQVAARKVALRTALANGVRASAEQPPGGSPLAPPRMRVTVSQPLRVGIGAAAIAIPLTRTAVAEVRGWLAGGESPGPGDYPGPFLYRQGKPMRPDVATAFDRMAAAASRAGLALLIASAWRSSTEQARLFAAHPDPRWVARPGQSLHRLGTELDIGPPAAYQWLAVNSGRFGFLKRYPWEPWHFGYTRSPGSSSVGWGRPTEARAGALPVWVPAKYRPLILAAAVRWGVSAAVLAAQIRAESDFNPVVVSSAGAQGIAQLMPYEAGRFHVDPFNPAEAIGAQAQLMRELLARFGSVPLALAAYNAGPNAVARCGCVPPYTETRNYVARILGWLKGAGFGATGPSVALIE